MVKARVGTRDILRQRLPKMRAKLGLSQTKLSTLARVSRPVLSELEQGRGNPSLSVLERIADALGTNLRELLTPRTKSHRAAVDETSNPRSLQRYSTAGRRPSYKTWLQNPPPGSATAKAARFGVDLTLLAQTLALTPEQRLQRVSKGRETLRFLRSARTSR